MGAPNSQSTDVTPKQVLIPAFVAGTTFINPVASLIYGGMYEPMEKAGVYQPISLGLQKLGMNEDAANMTSYFATDLGIGLLPVVKNRFINAYNKAWNQTYGNLNNLGISPFRRVTKNVNKLVKKPSRNYYPIEEMANNIAERRAPNTYTKYVNQEAIDNGYETYRNAVNNAAIDNIQSIANARINFSKLKKRTTQELNDFNKLLTISPEYGIFLSYNPTLDGLSQEAIDAFIEHQSLSVRGIGVQEKIPKTTTGAGYVRVHNASAINDKKAEKFLTTPPENPLDRLGNRGLYTSNGRYIADKFMRPETNGYNSASYQGIVHYDFNIDRSKPLEEQLRQYRSKIRNYDWDITDPREEMIEATYVKSGEGATKNIYERSINPKGVDKPVVNLRKLQYFGKNLPNLHGRWGLNDLSAVSDLDLFIPKQPSRSFGEFLNFARRLKSTNEFTIKKRNPNYSAEYSNAYGILKSQLEKRDKLVRQLEKKHNFVTKSLKSLLVTPIVGGVGAAVGLIKASNDRQNKWYNDHAIELSEIINKELGNEKSYKDMTDEEFEKRLDQEHEIIEREYNKYKESLKK